MEISKEHFTNYILKINCFVSCLQSHKWIQKASKDDIILLFQTADDIERTLKKLKSTKFKKKLETALPNFDLTSSCELLLEYLIMSPVSTDDIAKHGINEFLIYHTRGDFQRFLCKSLTNQKLKSQLIFLNQKLQPKKNDALKELELVSIFYLWEELLLASHEQFTKVIIDKLNNKTLSLLLVIDKAPVCRTSFSIIDVIVKYLREEKSVKIWGKILNIENLNVFSNLCNKYSSLVPCILHFLDVYESEAQSDFDEELNVVWSHKDLDFNTFVKIIQKLLEKDGDLRSQLNEYLVSKRNDFDANFTFWTDVCSCV